MPVGVPKSWSKFNVVRFFFWAILTIFVSIFIFPIETQCSNFLTTRIFIRENLFLTFAYFKACKIRGILIHSKLLFYLFSKHIWHIPNLSYKLTTYNFVFVWTHFAQLIGNHCHPFCNFVCFSRCQWRKMVKFCQLRLCCTLHYCLAITRGNANHV